MYKVIMKLDEEYEYGAYEDRNTANEVAIKVREQRNVETYVVEDR